jgi:hypothetical protein
MAHSSQLTAGDWGLALATGDWRLSLMSHISRLVSTFLP